MDHSYHRTQSSLSATCRDFWGFWGKFLNISPQFASLSLCYQPSNMKSFSFSIIHDLLRNQEKTLRLNFFLIIFQYFLNPLKKFFSAAEIEKIFVNIPVSFLIVWPSLPRDTLIKPTCSDAPGFSLNIRTWLKFTRAWWSTCRIPSWTETP